MFAIVTINRMFQIEFWEPIYDLLIFKISHFPSDLLMILIKLETRYGLKFPIAAVLWFSLCRLSKLCYC